MKSDRDRIHELETSKVEGEDEDIESKTEVAEDENVKEATVETINRDNIKVNNNSKGEINKKGFFNWFKK